MPTPKRYQTIVVDPPWDGPAATKRFDRKHPPGTKSPVIVPYQTMSGIQIASLRISDIAANRAQLFLWATALHLGDAYLLMQSWGFQWRGTLIWKKPLGIGRHVRSEAEFLLWGAMPGAPAVKVGTALRQIHEWPRPKRHSEKPAEAYRLIRQISDAPRIDIFARQHRPGFRPWGNEVPDSAPKAA